MRTLATIQEILKIETIPNADKVELANIMGWKVLIGKNQFKEGDLCVFFEVDSLLPQTPEFEFMRQHKFRVKTMKSNRLGVISEGLAMPMNIIPDNYDGNYDVTELLGVKKWEQPEDNSMKMGFSKGTFPSFILKTDEIRLQSAMGCIEEFKGEKVYITQKNDGTSFTAYQLLVDEEFNVCSRNEIKCEDSVYWEISNKYRLSERLKEFCKKERQSYAIQGELCGPKFGHKNPMELKERDLFLFNIYNITKHCYLDYHEFIQATLWLGLKPVTILYEGIFDMSLETLEEFAKGNYPGTQNPREGIVIRPIIEKHSKILNGRLSVKVINKDFSLRYEK
jgi:RNA ligase (TIGR02306 family)